LSALFKDFGLPFAIRTDNGQPCASGGAFFGLSKFSVWWLRLGIRLERIRPGHPEQNGHHERMHLTLKKETTRPAARTSCNSKAASIASSTASTKSTPTEHSTCAIQPCPEEQRVSSNHRAHELRLP
jgi:transposase InsO family protein